MEPYDALDGFSTFHNGLQDTFQGLLQCLHIKPPYAISQIVFRIYSQRCSTRFNSGEYDGW